MRSACDCEVSDLSVRSAAAGAFGAVELTPEVVLRTWVEMRSLSNKEVARCVPSLARLDFALPDGVKLEPFLPPGRGQSPSPT